MSLFYGDSAGVLDNRKNFLGELGINYRDLVCARQVHSAKISRVSRNQAGCGALAYDNAIADSDALITDEKGLPLAVFTADCLSLFIYDPRTPAIAIVHAGWRSSSANIAAQSVARMQEAFGSPAKDLCVGLGPAIRECCYSVGEEFKDLFPQEVRKKDGRYYLDLAGVNTRQLLEAGVNRENIFDSRICTCCRIRDFFSFRRNKDECGRMISVIMLKR